MTTTQETQKAQEKRPELDPLDPLYIDYMIDLSDMSLIRCPCADGWHIIENHFADKPLRVYDYAIIDCPIRPCRFIALAFFWQGEHHRAMMVYSREAHRLLKSLHKQIYDEETRLRPGVLLIPYRHETPKGIRKTLLKPAV